MNTSKFSRIYIHIPFCSSKCDYCAFYSLPSPDEELISAFFRKLKDDIRGTLFASPIQSIYVGGGTPGYLPDKYLSALVEILKKLNISKETEISIECNPDSLTESKIEIISSFFNRVSLGVQTLNSHFRTIIGRSGSIKDIDEIIQKFKLEGIDNISCDLIYGIPGQTIEDFTSDLNRVLDFGVKHFSAYSLTMEENSALNGAFTTKELESAEDTAALIWETLPDMISNRGFFRYEISNYALKNFECQHNFSTWFGASYAGFGPTASSFNGALRWTNPSMKEWLSGKPPEVDSIPDKNRILELFVMGLRTVLPWKITKMQNGIFEITSYFGVSFYISQEDWQELKVKLDNLYKDELVNIMQQPNEISVSSTEKGMAFWNDLALNII